MTRTSTTTAPGHIFNDGDHVKVDPAQIFHPLLREWIVRFGVGPFAVQGVGPAYSPGPQAHPQEFFVAHPDHPDRRLNLPANELGLPLSGCWFVPVP